MLQSLKLTKRRLGFSWMNWVRSKIIAFYTMMVIMLVVCVYLSSNYFDVDSMFLFVCDLISTPVYGFNVTYYFVCMARSSFLP